MYREQRITTVVPAHNEARHIGGVIQTMPPCVDHIVIVDDGSRDGTSEAAQACQDARTLVLRTVRNEGVGGAMVTGYRKALELGCDIVVKMDGDGQMAPEYLTSLLDAIVDQNY